MPRAGLTPQTVTAAALTLSRVAGQLGVRPPSLYNHIDGLDGLTRAVALDGINALADACRTAVMGRAGADGLIAMARAYRAFAAAHPGVYPLTQIVRPGDAEYEASAARVLEPVLALLGSFGLADTARIHAARAVRSALHGFVMLEQQAGFGLDVDVDASFEWMLRALVGGLSVDRA